MRGGDSKYCARIGAERRAAIEAEPADPQQSGADHRERQIVGYEIVRAVAAAGAEQIGADQAGDSGIEVYDGTAGKIEHAGTLQKAATPDPVRDRHIDNQKPKR